MAQTSAILPLKQKGDEFVGKLYGAETGAPDNLIWAVSRQYPTWGIFYNEGSPDKIEFKSSGNVKASIALDNGEGKFGDLYDNNDRVYSPNNKPTPTDVGAEPANANIQDHIGQSPEKHRVIDDGVNADDVVWSGSHINTRINSEISTLASYVDSGLAGKLGATAQAVDADKVDGVHAKEMMRYQSLSNFVNGTLIRTSIDASVSSGESFIIKIIGKSYATAMPPFMVLIQGYIYNDTFINYSALDVGANIGTIKILEDAGDLCIYIPRISYWNSFQVYAGKASAQDDTPTNRVTSIVDSVEPTSTKKVTCTPYKVYSEYHKPTMSELGGKTTAEITSEIATAVANLVSSAPGLLNTLDELALALGDDPNFATTITQYIDSGLASKIGASALTPYATIVYVDGEITSLASYVDAGLNGKAPLANPIFTGTPQVNGNLDIWGSNLDRYLYMGSGVGGSYGFKFKYRGTGSGNDNDFHFYADNQGGTDVQVYEVKQDGSWDFKIVPTINGQAIVKNDDSRLVSHSDVVVDGDVAEANSASKIAKRNSSGDIFARLFRSEYSSQNSSGNYYTVMNALGTGADNYIRPISKANVKIDLGIISLGSTSTTAHRGDHGVTAYNHSQATHAPSNAQKNSDITKAEIEAKLTGTLTTHKHSTIVEQRLSADKKIWIGTEAQYGAIGTKDSNTLYFCTA